MKSKFLILNDDLRKSFDPHNRGISIPHKSMEFSGGEPHIVLDVNAIPYYTHVAIVTKLRTAFDVMQLAVAVSALNNSGKVTGMSLLIGYMPGSRQDRVCNEGEALTAKVYTDMINGMTNWTSIQVLDSHSDVSPALLDESISIDNSTFVRQAIRLIDVHEPVIVSPDAGANKKVHSIVQMLTNEDINVDMIRADKKRDLATGNILETVVYAENLTGKECVIVDDICDGGRTFIELAKALKAKGASSVILVVTHGIFSKGYDVVLEHVDQIVTTNSFADLSDDDADRITVLGINEHQYKWAYNE